MSFAESLGVPTDTVQQIYQLLQTGKMSLTQFQDRLTQVTKKVQEEHLQGMVRHAVSEQLKAALPKLIK